MRTNFYFKKQYGQNFLNNPGIVKRIVSEANILEDSLVIEVGPGSGALTKELAKIAKNVIAYEIDPRLEETLDNELRQYPNVDVIYQDFLKADVKSDLSEYDYLHLYFVSNLPYYITTPIIAKIIEDDILVERMIVMVQKEVGDRFTAHIGSKDYNSLTIFLNYYFSVSKLFFVGRNNFVPKPNVDSVVVAFDKKRDTLFLKNKEVFFSLVRDSFKFKRKMLRNNLRDYPLIIIEGVLKQYGYDLSVRAEELSLQVFVDISNALVDSK